MKPSQIEIGTIFNKLIVKSKEISTQRHSMYKCLCDCGNYIITRGSSLLANKSKSCGCIKNNIWKNNFIHTITHGDTIGGKKSLEYNAYQGMIKRCYNKKTERYPNYGGRGIIVCDRWLESFENFLIDMGRKPSSRHSLDRYPNVNGNYELSNCRWGTAEQQSSNKTNTVRLIYNGLEIHQAGLSKLLNVNPHAIEYHINKGKNGDEIFNYFKNKIK